MPLIYFLSTALRRHRKNGHVSIVNTSCFCHAIPRDLQRMHGVMR